MMLEHDEPNQALHTLYDHIQKTLANKASLQQVDIPKQFSQIKGQWKDDKVEMRTQRYTNARYESITITGLFDSAEKIKTVTLIGLPHTGQPSPIIGLDAVALGKRWALLALDLSPIDDDYWNIHCKVPLTKLHQQVADSVQIRKLPDFAKSSFSSLALICAVNESHEQAVSCQLNIFFDDVISPLLSTTEKRTKHDSSAASERNLAWRKAERNNRKEQKALASLFGEDIAQQFIEEFLFPIDEI